MFLTIWPDDVHNVDTLQYAAPYVGPNAFSVIVPEHWLAALRKVLMILNALFIIYYLFMMQMVVLNMTSAKIVFTAGIAQTCGLCRHF
tara:strand:- start:118 stop:381 length:264 start_codon:yes stop_codon:yes gene_type:complete